MPDRIRINPNPNPPNPKTKKVGYGFQISTFEFGWIDLVGSESDPTRLVRNPNLNTNLKDREDLCS